VTRRRRVRRTVRRQVVLDHPYLLLRLDTERDERGREHTYLWGTGPSIAQAVPVWDDGTVTLLSQRRHGLRVRSIEVPGGHVDPGESPAAAARRELREETGIVAARVTPLLRFFPAVKLQQPFHVFLATGLRHGAASPDDDEDLRLLRVPLARACAMALSGRVRHGPTIVALLAARERLRS
jgi:ADP-ribose pyrophosphatase